MSGLPLDDSYLHQSLTAPVPSRGFFTPGGFRIRRTVASGHHTSEVSSSRRRERFRFFRAIGFGFLAGFFFSLLGNPEPSLERHVLVGFVFGAPIGALMGVLGQTRFLRPLPSFALTILVRTVVLSVGILGCLSLSLLVLTSVTRQLPPWDGRVLEQPVRAVVSGQLWSPVLFTLAAVFVISSVLAISAKLGPGVLLNWITGRYHQPREEERFFMFLDMRHSTTLAEELGNFRFSALVRDFMADLTDPILDTKGEVSHYIGDEAVLTWRIQAGQRDTNAVRFFFAFQARLAARSAYYQRAYGLVPEFKAGLHCGRAVVTEVGEVKSELVYHGDVVNTTARLQGLCRASELLVSRAAVDALELAGSDAFHAEPLGPRTLKGRTEPIEVFEITQKDSRR